MFDITGKRVFSEQGRVAGTTDELVLDLSALQSGNYILRIGARTAKVVKH